MIINTCPLSYVTPDDLKEPLTPAHFLKGKRTMSIPDGISGDQDWDDDIQITIPELSRRMRHLNSVLNHFWKQWNGEYLIELWESHDYGSIEAQTTTISAGDVVLVHDYDPWTLWKLAKVEEVITGWDGHSWGAVIRVPGKNHSKLLRHPIQRLYPLETSCNKESKGGNSKDDSTITEPKEVLHSATTSDSEASSAKNWHKRVAAIAAADRVKACAVCENLWLSMWTNYKCK